ncbi:phosphate-transporting ATPase [endosymbiont of Acanthamoeba sp. UWC8]|uniref:amino acid ABC transporter ATP-binding protein n=1 Tax=endosymbiont of Acanthamoeba sp. UWC8 TaxID=86106 RepID=UPI0004D12E2A|nr:amino acid ABC transporter ATP-binding protein [endosymbiont of Acanthamoeba sp. UWC8]AIF81974.1 phosphate-transporting ATPase [endosymbiont of Acanthamoeba sp. UWC8]
MLSINNLTKYFGDHKVLDGINFKVSRGEVISIIGSSGSGKSTILRCIAGLEDYTQGEIKVGANSKKHNIGMVFQNFCLFPNMTVLQNLTYAPVKILKKSKQEAEDKAIELLKKVGLETSVDKYPSALSGGQKQRAAIARTLCMEPEILLFDEPTSALDPENVKEVLETIKQLAHTNITLIIVTHEMLFAKEISDRVIFIDGGKILEDASTYEIFNNPKSERLKLFLKNIL